METDIFKAEHTAMLINEEITWLEQRKKQAPRKVAAELQAMIDKRKAVKEQIDNEMIKVAITIPDEAAEYIEKEDTEKA